MRSKIERIRHMSLSWRSCYYIRRQLKSHFLVTGFPQSAIYTTEGTRGGCAPRGGQSMRRPIPIFATLVNITARILISSFLHFALPGGISGGHAQDIRSWRLKRESGLVPSRDGISIKKKKKSSEITHSIGRVIAAVKVAVQLWTCKLSACETSCVHFRILLRGGDKRSANGPDYKCGTVKLNLNFPLPLPHTNNINVLKLCSKQEKEWNTYSRLCCIIQD